MDRHKTGQFAKSFMSATSMTLIGKAQDRDEQACNDLCTLYLPNVRFWCGKYGVAKSDIEDVTQEVFRLVFRGIDRFEKSETQGSFRAWIWTVTRNRIRDYFKSASHRMVASGGTEGHIQMNQIPESPPSPDDSDFNENQSLTHQALGIVKNEVKEITFNAFWRSTVDNVAPHVVADELGISLDSVYQAKSRVLKRMRELLE